MFPHSATRLDCDTSTDHPHQQRERSVPCRTCGRRTYRAHAVCLDCVDVLEDFGCCPRCTPGVLSPTVRLYGNAFHVAGIITESVRTQRGMS